MANPELVSIVIPVFNESAVLDELISRCLTVGESFKHPFELILVDDGSSDDSAERITTASNLYPNQIIGVLLNRNYGQHAAVMAGFAESRGAVVITLDADLQNPPEEMPKLLAKIDEGYDVVGSVRMNRRDSLFRKFSSKIINRTVQKVTGVMMRDYGCMLRAYRRNIIDAMLQCHERSTFIPILANTFAHKATEVDVHHAERADGDSKYNLWKLINLQFDLLTSMTTAPLRLLNVLGAAVALLGFLFGVLLLGMRIFFGSVWAAEGVFTLFAILFIFIGAQFFAMGLLGEYIGRIYQDVRARPRYFVRAVVGRSAKCLD